jgi:hypothetical protein
MFSKEDFLSFSERVYVLPVIHGSGDFAQEVRDRLLRLEADCIAVPLPPSFQHEVEAGVEELPFVSMAAAEEPEEDFLEEEGEGGNEGEEKEEEYPAYNYVPIDPCQPVIAALRLAAQERVACAFIDLEVSRYEPEVSVLPDPYALKKVPLEAFAASLLPAAPRPAGESQRAGRIRFMGKELHRLEESFERIVFVCPALDWPWIREAYVRELPAGGGNSFFQPVRRYPVSMDTLAFVLGELPFVTYLYEKRREELRGDRHLSIDGVKELLLETRSNWLAEHEPAHNWVTPQRLQIFLQYVRSLTLKTGRLTPDLFTLTLAAKQVAGDEFALTLTDTARYYPYQEDERGGGDPEVNVGVDLAEFPDSGAGYIKNRLGGSAVLWRSISLKPKPRPEKKKEWAQRWDPYGQCSWPPEDTRIESFHTHVREQTKALLGADLARTEKFTTSIKDGLDMRETLRNWHTGSLYVKEIPPARGNLEIVVFLFDTPADPLKYAWRTMWFAEHEEESSLCMYATPCEEEFVGPGVAQSIYGGAFFLFPPRYIPDVWNDPRFEFAQTMEEKLIAGACYHSRERFVALVSTVRPLPRWRRIARQTKKQLIHIPLGRFSRDTIDRIRRFHVLNGKHVRSYAAKFVREM